MQALETIKIIARVDPSEHVLAGRLFTFDGLRGGKLRVDACRWLMSPHANVCCGGTVSRTARLRSCVANCFCASQPTALPAHDYEAFCSAPFDDHVAPEAAGDGTHSIDVVALKRLLDCAAPVLLVDVRTAVQYR